LNSQGETGLRKKPFSGSGIRYILQNEVYVGDRVLQKQPPKGLLTKQPDRSQPFESHYIREDHEAIILREMWEQVQAKFKETDPGMRQGKNVHFLYGWLFCGECGAPMKRRTLQEYCRAG
jgi:hypothetical protein